MEERRGVAWIGIIELRFALAAGGSRGIMSSGCLLRLAVVIERLLKTYHYWVRGPLGLRALSRECRTWCEKFSVCID